MDINSLIMLWMMKMVMGLGRRFENDEMGDWYVVRVVEHQISSQECSDTAVLRLGEESGELRCNYAKVTRKYFTC